MWTNSCLQCQAAKVLCHQCTPVKEIPVPAMSFTHVHVDLVGPLPLLWGFSYLLTCVDWITRWLEAILQTSITADTCSRASLLDWVTWFRVPRNNSYDRGP